MSLCDFVASPHRDLIRHPMCFCVFVFFSEKHKKHIDPIFFVFFSTIRLHQRANVFLCVCVFFLPKNTKTHRPNVSLSFFNIRIAPDRLCVFVFLSFFWTIRLHQRANVFLCFFLPKNTKITLVNLTKKTQKDIKHKPFEKNCNEEKKHKKHIWSFSAS